jgi:hypothetical protein
MIYLLSSAVAVYAGKKGQPKEWEIERGDDDDEKDELLREMSS